MIKFLREDLKTTVEKFIHCWNISECFYEHIENNHLSSAGIKPYDFANYNSYNKFLTRDKNNKFLDPKKPLKTVKSQILSILHHLTNDLIS